MLHRATSVLHAIFKGFLYVSYLIKNMLHPFYTSYHPNHKIARYIRSTLFFPVAGFHNTICDKFGFRFILMTEMRAFGLLICRHVCVAILKYCRQMTGDLPKERQSRKVRLAAKTYKAQNSYMESASHPCALLRKPPIHATMAQLNHLSLVGGVAGGHAAKEALKSGQTRFLEKFLSEIPNFGRGRFWAG